MYKNETEKLIALVKYKENVSEESIMEEIGYNKSYISQVRSRGNYPKKLLDKLKERYKDITEDKVSISPILIESVMVGIASRQQVQGMYIAELYANMKGVTVAKVLQEMVQLEQEKAELLLKSLH
jgi:hypothetical protein